MTFQTALSTPSRAQRARGVIAVSAKHGVARGNSLDMLRQEGSYRTVFPRAARTVGKDPAVETVIVNTAGGVTGGDRFSASFLAHENASLSVTTQAAERIYRASGTDAGQITNTLGVGPNAQLFWLPQETILFDGSCLQRRLSVDVNPSATFLMVEPLVFGRSASGEHVRSGSFDDVVSISSAGNLIYLDRVKLEGDIEATLERPAIADGAKAMASVVLVDRNAHNHLATCRDLLPPTAGVSLLGDTVLVVRLLASDSYGLRCALLPILNLLTDNTVPKNWRL